MTLAFHSTRNQRCNCTTILATVRLYRILQLDVLNICADQNDTAYTLWVYDCETETEWYAPVRYLEGFDDLRAASIRLDKAIAQFPYPVKRGYQWRPIN
jgi:hypothetical protein